jgi:regulator of PEP synthase PpsR (kinase-PPPase family)
LRIKPGHGILINTLSAISRPKVTNVPLVPGIEPPEDLFLVDPGRVFGLDINTSRLISHRIKRISDMMIPLHI